MADFVFFDTESRTEIFRGGDKAFMYKQCSTLQSSERQKEFQHMLLQMMQEKTFQEITVTGGRDFQKKPLHSLKWT